MLISPPCNPVFSFRYPDEDEFDNYLSSHGGSCNAYTAEEDTNFYFDVTSGALPGALDRFAHFFIGPKFDPEMVPWFARRARPLLAFLFSFLPSFMQWALLKLPPFFLSAVTTPCFLHGTGRAGAQGH